MAVEKILTGRRILVTGGAGFLGFHLAQRLPSMGAAYLAFNDIDEFPQGEYPQGALTVNADVRDRDEMNKLIKDNKIDTIIHCAAALPLWKKEDIFSTNVGGLRTTLEVARQNNVEKFVFISSTAVYGVPDKHPLIEDDPMEGVGNYGESKILGEQVCREFMKKGMNIAIIRPKTFIGTARLGVFQILYDWVDSGKRIPIIGKGENRYQLLEVDDLVQAIALALAADSKLSNDTFNVGAKVFQKVKLDVGSLCDFAGTGARPMPTPAKIVKPMLAFFELIGVSPLYKWVYGTADKDSFVSTDKIEQKLGWKPQFSNEDALITSHKWYLEHKVELLRKHSTGVTHRVGWDQGILKVFKKWL
ncbi:MAG: NAD(P)-dependent oxidoreductase [Candidatus Auribacterota bacterium]|jgi:nucleoside-diphosphate-sugar epimerase|nr:NAD(P)-dependent oxidoreductase [Candidatus Auribacterota bacterium]